MAQHFPPLLAAGMRYLSSATTEDMSDEEYGINVSYNEIYNSIVFLIAIYVAGFIFSRFLRMPALVGEIVAGMLLGPELLNTFVPYPAAFVLLGQIGLVLLVLEAGIDIDLATLKIIGPPGFLIAFCGSMCPIGIGICLALAMGLSTSEAIAAGATFGATSVGITMNILRGGGIINTPVGQLIIAAAVIDDMIALIVLSELQALIDPSIPGIVIPIVSALAFLFIGGFIAIVTVPVIMDRYILPHVREELRGRCSLAVMIILLLALLPATTYSKASYLMGAFLAGLAFCSDHDLHVLFVSQFKRIIQWLMRIFFACSIGFQIPIKTFGDGQVIWKGFVFTLALIGKVATGLLVPNFHGHKVRRYSGLHRIDCTIVGCSMPAEGEFAFVIAVFGIENHLTDSVTYAAVILAVLLSTIIAPFLLRIVISNANRQGKKRAQEAEAEFLSREEDLEKGIRENRVLFLCIQIRSEPAWGLLSNVLRTTVDLDLEVIDSRTWHPEHEVTVNVNEMYVKDSEPVTDESSVDERIAIIKQRLFVAIGQKDAEVKVERWIPYAVAALEAKSTLEANTNNEEEHDVIDCGEKNDATDILEKIDEDTTLPQDQPLGLRSRSFRKKQLSLTELVFQEAQMNLDQGQETAGPRRRPRRKKQVSELRFGQAPWQLDKSADLEISPTILEKTVDEILAEDAAASRHTKPRLKKVLSAPDLTSSNIFSQDVSDLQKDETYLLGMRAVDIYDVVESRPSLATTPPERKGHTASKNTRADSHRAGDDASKGTHLAASVRHSSTDTRQSSSVEAHETARDTAHTAATDPSLDGLVRRPSPMEVHEAKDPTATQPSPNLDGLLRWPSSLHEAEDSTAIRPSPNLVGLVRQPSSLHEASDTTTIRPIPSLDGFVRQSSSLASGTTTTGKTR